MDVHEYRMHPTQAARDGIIVELLEEAKKQAAEFSRRHGRFEDLYGEACLGLTEAVDMFPAKAYDDNILPYVRRTIRNRLLAYVERDHLVRVPHARGRRPVPAVEPMRDIAVCDHEMVELRLDWRQEAIYKMLLWGYKQKEIAERLGYSPEWNCQQVKNIGRKLREAIL